MGETGEADEAADYPATELFRQAARRAQARYVLRPEDFAEIEAICSQVQGMPLAIVLAAAWVDSLSITEIRAQIERDLDFLETEFRDLPARQRSMRATFNYTWNLLDTREQTLYAQLSVFRGGFTRAAARAVTDTPLRLLARLVGKSLLHYDPTADRYQMHELLRQFGAEELSETGDEDALRTVHARHFLHWVAAQDAKSSMYHKWDEFAAIAADYENIRAAWRWAVAQTDIELLAQALQSLYLFLQISGRDLEAVSVFDHTLENLPKTTAGDDDDDDTERDIVLLRARIMNRLLLREPHRAAVDAAEHVALFRASGDKFEEAVALERLAPVIVRKEGFEAGFKVHAAAVDLYRQLEDPRLIWALLVRAYMLFGVGRDAEGSQAAKESLDLGRSTGDRINSSSAQLLLGVQQLTGSGDYSAVTQIMQKARVDGQTLRSEGYPSTPLIISLIYLGALELIRGELESANDTSQQVSQFAAESGRPWDVAANNALAGLINATIGAYDRASAQAGEVFSQQARFPLIDETLASWAQVLAACGRGDTDLARSLSLKQLKVSVQVREHPDAAILLFYVPAFAWLISASGRSERAVEILALARAHPACPQGWWQHLHLLQILEARLMADLSANTYAAAQKKGQELTLGRTMVALLEEFSALEA